MLFLTDPCDFFYDCSFFIAQPFIFPGVNSCLGFLIVYLVGFLRSRELQALGVFLLPSQSVPPQKVSVGLTSLERPSGLPLALEITPPPPRDFSPILPGVGLSFPASHIFLFRGLLSYFRG